jgi:hypothetical protein
MFPPSEPLIDADGNGLLTALNSAESLNSFHAGAVDGVSLRRYG